MLQVEHVRREWEAKLAEGKSQFEAKLAEHYVGVAEVSRLREQYQSTLAEKDQVSLSLSLSLSLSPSLSLSCLSIYLSIYLCIYLSI